MNEYAAICGITEDELKSVFYPGIAELAESKKVSPEEMLATLKENYDGYHFCKNSPDIYNPFSILSALDAKEITNYWFRSGTASFLLKLLKRDNFFLPELDCTESLESDLSAKESYLQNPIALLYEAGFMTIKKYDEELDLYTLGLPNKEVATSFSEALMPIYSSLDLMDCRNSFIKMRKAVMKGDADGFMRHLQTFLKGNPYSNTELAERETYFKNNIYLVCKALGFMPRNEEETCNSRMDIMLRTRRFIYIFELKTDDSAEKGMAQIEDKGYAMPYIDEGRKIIKISANYSSPANNIDSWIIME
ncbi:MAG: ATP-binding protein [Muribaculum sp.]|nr:ATP-binding protein [Muribaculum sp.]